jgi:transposase
LTTPFNRSTLPNDVEALKDIIEQQASLISALTARVNQLEERYDKLARLHFGQSSEKVSTLNIAPEVPPDLTDSPSDEPKTDETAALRAADLTKNQNNESRENHQGRNRLAPHLTRQTIEHDLAAHQKVCRTCGSFLSFIGCEEREQLESAIEKYIVLVHRRRKYACKNKHCTCQTIVTAPTPFEPIEKSLAGPHLLAEVIVDKYCDHLPWYRLQQRFARQGIAMSRSTLWHWTYRSALLLEPLVDTMIAHQIASDYMFADEITIPTLWTQTPENKGRKAKTNYFWVYTSLFNDNKNTPIVVYRFAEGRGSEYPIEFLKNFKGYLHVDAYSGYNPLFNPTFDDIEKAYVNWCIEVGCFAHARRYFVDALKSNPKSIAQEVILLIADLYNYEAEFKDKKLTYEEIAKFKKPRIIKAFFSLKRSAHLYLTCYFCYI